MNLMLGLGLITANLRGGGRTYYVDPAIGSGDGLTEATAWDNFDEINALSAAELNGATIAIKSGEIVYDMLSLGTRDDVTVTTYGGSAPAIVDGSSAVAYTWVAATATRVWRTTTPGTQVGLFINDVATRYCATEGQMNQVDYGYWYGAGADGTALYVRLPAGVDPSVVSVRKPGSVGNFAAYFTQCNRITLDNVHFRRGQNHVVNFDSNPGVGYVGPTVRNCIFSECGRQNGASPSGNDLLNIQGVSATYRATSPVIYNNVFRDNVTAPATNGCNGLEMNYVSSPIIYGNTFRTIWGTVVEFYRDVQNGVVKQNLMLDFGGQAWWCNAYDGSSYYPSSGNSFENNICISLGNLATMAKNWDGNFYNGPTALTVTTGNNRAYNNTFVGADSTILSLTYNASAGNSSFTFRNNVVYKSEGTTNSNATHVLGSTGWSYVSTAPAAAQELNIDYNRYYQRRPNTFRGLVNATQYNSLALWQALDADLDPHSTHGDPSLAAFLGSGSASIGVTASVIYGKGHASYLVANAGIVNVVGHGRSIGDYVSMPIAAGGTLYSRVASVIDADNFRLEYQLYGNTTIASGATVTHYPNWASPNVAPSGTAGVAPRDTGVNVGTDSNVPLVDYAGTTRSTSTPDMGAIEA